MQCVGFAPSTTPTTGLSTNLLLSICLCPAMNFFHLPPIETITLIINPPRVPKIHARVHALFRSWGKWNLALCKEHAIFRRKISKPSSKRVESQTSAKDNSKTTSGERIHRKGENGIGKRFYIPRSGSQKWAIHMSVPRHLNRNADIQLIRKRKINLPCRQCRQLRHVSGQHFQGYWQAGYTRAFEHFSCVSSSTWRERQHDFQSKALGDQGTCLRHSMTTVG